MKKPYVIDTINGLKVAFYQVDGLPAVKANLYVYSGSSFEKGSRWGAFHFIEHLCYESTKLFPDRESLELYKEEFGLNNNAATSYSYTKFWTYGPKQSLKQALTLLNELAFNALLPEPSYPKQVGIISQEIKGKWDNPGYRFGMKILKQLYGENHIYTKDAGGQAEYLVQLKREDLSDIYDKFFKNENSVLTVTGDFNVSEARDMVKELFVANGGNKIEFPKEAIKPGERVNFHVEDVEQDRISLMWLCDGYKEMDFEDKLAMQVGAYILGGSSRGLLNKQLREALHLVYSTGFRQSLFPFAGSLEAWSATTNENTQAAVDEMKRVIYEFLDKPIDENLFRRSVNFIKSNISLAFDSIHNISDSITDDIYFRDKIYLPSEVSMKLDMITEKDVREQLKNYIVPGGEYLAIMTKNKMMKIK